MQRKDYMRPKVLSVKSFETSALTCAKTPGEPPVGAWHFSSAYDTFTGHFGGGFGGSESMTGSAGIGWGPGGTSMSAGFYYGQCTNWVTFSS
jgi:hypothetical protein